MYTNTQKIAILQYSLSSNDSYVLGSNHVNKPYKTLTNFIIDVEINLPTFRT